MIGVSHFFRGDYARAAGFFETALTCDESYVQARYHLGIALLHLGRCDESIAALEMVVHAYPDYPHAKSGLGVAYNSAGQPSKAILIFEELLEAQPRAPGHLLNLGYACHDAGLVERAIECFDQVVSSENSSNDVRAKAQKALDALQQD
jgi:tetratricopeptide (TPR) repeat protein